MRLLIALMDAGHQVYGMVRNRGRFPSSRFAPFLEDGRLRLIEGDMLVAESLPDVDEAFDAVYYLLHSMGAATDFEEREKTCAENFNKWMERVECAKIIFLGGLVPQASLSKHLRSRETVNRVLRTGSMPVTTLRASIIVGSGSASFEMIRDLAEKLPVMITPRWANTRCQPIAIRNVVGYLLGCLDEDQTTGEELDIGGPEVLTYKSLLEQYAEARGLNRWIIPVPFLTPRLSAHWLHLVTATTMSLAKSLIESLTNETICRDNRIEKLIPQKLLTYREAIDVAFARIAQNKVPSSWIDSLSSGNLSPDYFKSIQVPEHGILRDQQKVDLTVDREQVINAVWRIGGRNGWPSMNWAWKIRGVMDRMIGGSGIRRGRRNPDTLFPGDALDFWRVVLADRNSDHSSARLILSAEMKMPGEAWLEFEITDSQLIQTATMRPRGLFGRVYWFSVLPFHLMLFPQMAKRLAAGSAGGLQE